MIVGSYSKQMNSTPANAIRSAAWGSIWSFGRGLLTVMCFVASSLRTLNEVRFFMPRGSVGGGAGGIGVPPGAGGGASAPPNMDDIAAARAERPKN